MNTILPTKTVAEWLEAWYQHQNNPKENDTTICTGLSEKDDSGKWGWCGGQVSLDKFATFFTADKPFDGVFFNKKSLIFSPPLLSGDIIKKLLVNGYKIKYDYIEVLHSHYIFIE